MTATKNYRVDSFVAGLAIKAPCAAVAITNITLSGEQTVNGVAVVAGDRVLVIAQTSAIDNGIYNVESSAWQRTGDFDGNRDVVSGTFVTVATATVGRNPYYQITTANPITIGTTEINFTLADGPNVSYALTPTEDAAGLTDNDIDDSYEPGDVRRHGVTLDGSTDDAAAWQQALNVKGRVFTPDYSWSSVIGSQLDIKSGTNLEISDLGIMRRSWAGTNGTRPDNATIKNENAPTAAQISVDPGPLAPSTFDTDIHISGGQWGHLDDDPATYRGTHVALIAVRGGSFSGAFKTQRSEWCTAFWVEDFHIPDIEINVAEGGTDVSNDGLHIIGGKQITVGSVRGGCDDDLVAIGSNLNIGIDGISISSINGDSNGNAIKIFQIRSGSTSGYGAPTEEVKNVSVGKIVGDYADQRSGIVNVLISGHTNYDLVKNVIVDTVNAKFTGAVDSANAYAFNFSGGDGVHIGHATLTGTPIRNIINGSNVVNMTFGHLDSSAPSKSGERIADLDAITGFKFRGGNVACASQHGFKLSDVTDAEILANITNVENGFAGIILQGTSDCVVLTGTKITRKAAETTTIGVKSDSGATNTVLAIENGVDLTDVDVAVTLTTYPTDVKIGDFVGMKSLDDRLLTASATFTLSDGHLAELDNDNTLYNYNPSGTFPDGWPITVNNIAGVNGVTFDSAGISVAVVAGTSERFYYNLTATAWVQL